MVKKEERATSLSSCIREKCKISRYGIMDLFRECGRCGYKLLRYPLGESADLGFATKKDEDVVIFTIYMYNAEGISGVVGNITGLEVQYYDVFQYLTHPWFMFLLFMVSGISSRYYLTNHSDKEFFRSRTTKLLVPSTIGLFVFQFIQGYFNTRSSDAMNMMKTVPTPVAFLIMVLSGIGVLWCLPLIIAAVVLGLAFSVRYFGKNYADVPVNRYPLYTFFGYFASLAFLSVGARYLDFTNTFTSWMSRHSWGLYIFHYLGISIIAVEVGARHILPAVLVYVLSLVSAFVVAFILYELISKIPFFRWAVLGIKKNRKK